MAAGQHCPFIAAELSSSTVAALQCAAEIGNIP